MIFRTHLTLIMAVLSISQTCFGYGAAAYYAAMKELNPQRYNEIVVSKLPKSTCRDVFAFFIQQGPTITTEEEAQPFIDKIRFMLHNGAVEDCRKNLAYSLELINLLKSDDERVQNLTHLVDIVNDLEEMIKGDADQSQPASDQ